jgi:hypothetical protein
MALLSQAHTARVIHPPMDTSKFPIEYQIACIVLTALFLWSFSVAREPRGWRRLFQSMFSKSDNFSVNKNKVIDESLKRYGILIAMAILVADVTCFVMMVTYPMRMKQVSKEQREQQGEIQRIQGSNPELSRVKAF